MFIQSFIELNASTLLGERLTQSFIELNASIPLGERSTNACWTILAIEQTVSSNVIFCYYIRSSIRNLKYTANRLDVKCPSGTFENELSSNMQIVN